MTTEVGKMRMLSRRHPIRKRKNKTKNAGFICFQCVMLSYTANINARQRLE